MWLGNAWIARMTRQPCNVESALTQLTTLDTESNLNVTWVAAVTVVTKTHGSLKGTVKNTKVSKTLVFVYVFKCEITRPSFQKSIVQTNKRIARTKHSFC